VIVAPVVWVGPEALAAGVGVLVVARVLRRSARAWWAGRRLVLRRWSPARTRSHARRGGATPARSS
jgi:hypothetical protein